MPVAARLFGALWAIGVWLWAPAVLAAQVAIQGKVTDENGAPVPGARLELRSASASQPFVVLSESQGRFALNLPEPGEYLLRAEKPGFFRLDNHRVWIEEADTEIVVTLHHLRELAEQVDVTYSPPVIDFAETSDQKQLNNMEILDIPYPASHDFRNALPLFPGVLQDRQGRLHFNGGSTDQTSFNLDGFNVSDPASGQLDLRLNIDAVRSLDLETSRFSVEKSRGSAGALDIKTGMGDDRWRFGATNFIPGIGSERGLFINKWTPRATVSGPLVRSRAWFHHGFDMFYDVDTIRELPPGANRTRSLTTSNLTRFQVNLTPAHILTGSFLVNYIDANRQGLSFLDPAETTTHHRRNFVFGAVRDQLYLAGGYLIEFGFAASRGVKRKSPLGKETYVISPNGRRGNFFADITRHTERQQWIANFTLPTWEARGRHQLKFGADVQRSAFRQSAGRHDYLVLRNDGTPARYVCFAGAGRRRKTNLETALYAQDRWSLREGLLFELGLRADWDQIVRDLVWSPRLSAAWAPAFLRDTKLAAGWGVFNDSLNLEPLTRHQDQVSLATFFSPAGTVARGPVMTSFGADERALRVPRARLFSLSLERKLPGDLYVKSAYLRRRGDHGLTFTEGGSPDSAVIFWLRNQRSDRYDAVELTLRKLFAGQYAWLASYVFSRSRSNAVVDYSLENPVFAPQAPGPTDWDAPHRFLTWGSAPVPRRLVPESLGFLVHDTSVAFLVEARSGFPFSVLNEEGFLVGRPNRMRFPYYFNVNLHLERKFRFLSYLWALRFGFNNLTHHGNPNVVNNNVDSPSFLTFGRGQPRAFNVRLRFLGRR
ncbi:MAG: TonB-dependent receptor [Bryobacteraceae bacterium]|nr:TonB-dependent receptor [Bryobacteraceae bacterium]